MIFRGGWSGPPAPLWYRPCAKDMLTLCILVDFPVHKVCDCPLYTLGGHGENFLYNNVFMSLNVILILANSADPDEMQHRDAFHLGLNCVPKYPFMGFPVYKGYIP